jgi:DnaK suppressor protein
MTSNEREVLIAVLRAKQKELSRSLSNREDIAVAKASDVVDDMQFKAEREFVIRNLNRDSAMLRLIDLALARIVDGTYGVCHRCEEPISPRRMSAVPWAVFCIKCQEMAERDEVNADWEGRLQPSLD